MKLIKLFSVLAVGCLTSCAFTENINISEDGSGSYSLEMDGSAVMAMIPEDSIPSEKGKKDMDSTVVFKDLFATMKDSISRLPKDKQEKIKSLENFKMRMQMKEAEKKMLFSMMTDFKNVGELQDAMSSMDELQSIGKTPAAGGMPSGGMGSNNSELKYTYDGKKFTRKAIMKKAVNKAENDSMAEMYKAFFESSTYTVKYHFPKKVKKVSNKNAMFSEDRKTVTIEYPFTQYMNEPEKMNFEVTFE